MPVRRQLTVVVQRDRAQINLCALRTRNHNSFAILVFRAQRGIKGALLGYVEHQWEHPQGFVENGLDVAEPDNI